MERMVMIMGLTEQFADRVREHRERLGLTQDELAYRCSMNSGHLSQIERGVYEPRLETIMRIAKGCGITAGELLDFDSELTPPVQSEPVNKVISYMHMLDEQDQRLIVALAKTLLSQRKNTRSKARGCI